MKVGAGHNRAHKIGYGWDTLAPRCPQGAQNYVSVEEIAGHSRSPVRSELTGRGDATEHRHKEGTRAAGRFPVCLWAARKSPLDRRGHAHTPLDATDPETAVTGKSFTRLQTANHREIALDTNDGW